MTFHGKPPREGREVPAGMGPLRQALREAGYFSPGSGVLDILGWGRRGTQAETPARDEPQD